MTALLVSPSAFFHLLVFNMLQIKKMIDDDSDYCYYLYCYYYYYYAFFSYHSLIIIAILFGATNDKEIKMC